MGRKHTRRRLLGVSRGMALLIGPQPGSAQRLMMHTVTERRETIDIKRNGSRPSTKGPEAYFTGAVRLDPVFQVGSRCDSMPAVSPSSRALAPRGTRIR